MPSLFPSKFPRRRLLLPEGVNGVYHVVSRVVDRSMKLDEDEKQYFVELMHRYAAFCGVRVLSWVVMSNHFHLLVEVPPVDRANMSAQEVFQRLECIWGKGYMAKARELFATCKTPEKKRAFLDKVTYRMGDLRQFMKSLKQQFTEWFNKVHEREGTLWESRYRSVIVEGGVPVEEGHEGDGGARVECVSEVGKGGGNGEKTREVPGYEVMSDAARIVAAYIDLNPVRAGMVEDPADYRWSSYGAAVAGDASAQDGITRLWSCGVEEALAAHRVLVFEEGSEEHVPEEGEKSTRVGIAREKVREVLRQRGRLPLQQVLRLRVRYMTAGGVIGSRGFVRAVYEASKDALGEKRRPVSVPMRHGEWGGLHALRNLGKRLLE